MERKKLLLIDMYGLMYKFFFTLPRMTAPDGTPTNALYGIARVMMKVARDMRPDYLVVALDSSKPTFRHEMFPAYKAHRDKMPDELRAQLPSVPDLLDAMGVVPAQLDGFEADDIIGTYARIGAEQKLDVSIITGDKDLLQLVNDSVKVLLSRKGITDLATFDPAMVRREIGVSPEQIPDKKGLEGDKSDNIPGVPGVGEKSATLLLERFTTLEDIYDNINAVEKDALRRKLSENREIAFLSRRLATIDVNAPVPTDIETYLFSPPNAEKLIPIFRSLAFTSLERELGATVSKEPVSPFEDDRPVEKADWPWRVAKSAADVQAMVKTIRDKKRCCVDIETTGLDTFHCDIVGIALATEPGDAMYVPIGHLPPDEGPRDLFGDPVLRGPVPNQIPLESALKHLRPILEDARIAKLGHNLKFDALVLANHGVDVRGIAFDSFLAAYLLDPAGRRYGLKNLASWKLGLEFETYEDVVGEGKKQVSFARIPVEKAAPYACRDVDSVLRLEPLLHAELAEKQLSSVLDTLETPLVETLVMMERNGVRVDSEYLAKLSKDFALQEDRIRQDVQRIAGRELNLNSPKQVSALLFEQLSLRNPSKNSTDISALMEISADHEVVPMIIRYRQLSKLRGTYVDALPAIVNPDTGRIHTSFNQTATTTGRLSSSNPNLQNIPIRTDDGREIRRAFISSGPGKKLISADYSQVEIRLLAQISNDPTLLESFANNEDIHTRTASEVFNTPMDEVTKDLRRNAKAINFGIIYGMKEYGLSQNLGIPVREAADYIKKYFERYPNVLRFIEETQGHVAETGYALTLFGRRRYIPDAQSANRNQREFGFRAAVNACIQGTAADIMKLAMIDVHQAIRDGKLRASMLLQVHDELVFETDEALVNETATLARRIMEKCAERFIVLKLPLTVDVVAGDNWLDTEPVG